MPTCEHFVYTTAKTDSKTGYQFVAKSCGIKDSFLNNLTNYLFPLGVDPQKFTKSKSLLPISKEHVAYSIVKNIGRGYDGRDGTIYNHTMIMKTDNFFGIDCDTRILDKYFLEDYSIRGKLDPLYVQPEKIDTDFGYLNGLNQNLLKVVLFYLFKKNRIAIVQTIDEKFIQHVLSVIPPQRRFVPFSTLVLDPSRQTGYQIMQIPDGIQIRLRSNCIVINPRTISTTKIKLANDIGIKNIIDIINQGSQSQLLKLHKDFARIATHVSQTKKVKIKDIFDEKEFEKLAEKKEFSVLLAKVKSLYSSSAFNNSSPKTMITITKKIRQITAQTLKESQKSKIMPKEANNLTLTVKILLDCLCYMKQYTKKKISNTTQSEIEGETTRIESLLKQYSEIESAGESPFNIVDYWTMIAKSWLNYGCSNTLFWLGRR